MILFQGQSDHLRLVLGMTQYCCMLLGTLLLALVADVAGRLKTLFACLFIAFIGGLSSAFVFNILPIFIVLRGIVGFATGNYGCILLGLFWLLPFRFRNNRIHGISISKRMFIQPENGILVAEVT